MTRAAQARQKLSIEAATSSEWLVGPAALAAEIKGHNIRSASDTAWIAGPVALNR